jgi:hypothetical protein
MRMSTVTQFATLGIGIILAMPSRAGTVVSIAGDDFLINGHPTYEGRVWQGQRIEGLLLNNRLVQATFDDANPKTASRWAYKDSGKWDANRNNREFVAMMPEWRRHGLLSFTVNFQGGSPEGYSGSQPWENTPFNEDGSLRPAYMERMKRILDEADRLGMAPIVGFFYFGQSARLKTDENAIKATDTLTKWLLDGGWRNVLVEVNNEANPTYKPPILRWDRVHELILRVRDAKAADGHRLLVGTSFSGSTLPTTNVVAVSDFILIHGNGVENPARIGEMIRQTRALPFYRQMPILFNEDDHEGFDKPTNNMAAAVSEHASWGWFDWRRKGEDFAEGYQSVPVNWGMSSERKRTFYSKVAEITGSDPVGGQGKDIHEK